MGQKDSDKLPLQKKFNNASKLELPFKRMKIQKFEIIQFELNAHTTSIEKGPFA